ncbi:MAG: hypothetical protein OXI34_06310 [Chloroflexota bacterium]|nr:hypothetical protein [Chloroflexota bacterium]MDE2853366.1 hypothetical protein [Chloroflexota bacterium]MDE2945718.1 hypothetical protein [Chloroflexota bacterium]
MRRKRQPKDFAEIDAYLRGNGFVPTGSLLKSGDVFSIENLEEAQAVVARLSGDAMAADFVFQRDSDYGWLASGSKVISTYECQKWGALTTVTSKARVEIIVSGGSFTFDRFIAQWYELIGAPYGHDVRDIQLNNAFQNSGKTLRMQLNFNLVVQVQPIVYVRPIQHVCHHQV